MRRGKMLAAAALLLLLAGGSTELAASDPARPDGGGSAGPTASAPNGSAAPGATDPAATVKVAVDPEIRTAIRSVVEALFPENPALMDRIAHLEELTAGRRRELLVQLALYLSEADSTETSMGGALLFHHLAFSADEMLDALVPRIDAGPEPFRRTVRDLLGTVDRPGGGAPDFSLYQERLARDPEHPAPGLIRYLYEVSPDAALESLMRLYGPASPPVAASAAALDELRSLDAAADRATPLPEDEAERARAALSTLSEDSRWWVRMYAAAVISRDPHLATPDVRTRLRSDPSPLVRSLEF